MFWYVKFSLTSLFRYEAEELLYEQYVRNKHEEYEQHTMRSHNQSHKNTFNLFDSISNKYKYDNDDNNNKYFNNNSNNNGHRIVPVTGSTDEKNDIESPNSDFLSFK